MHFKSYNCLPFGWCKKGSPLGETFSSLINLRVFCIKKLKIFNLIATFSYIPYYLILRGGGGMMAKTG